MKRSSFNRLMIQLLGTGVALALSACATMEPVHVARVELRALPTTTLSDQQFLTGQREGNPVTITGELRIPTMGKDKLPAVVLLHGSSGISGFVDDWAQFINGMGVATFVLDSFTARGIESLNNDQSRLSRLATTVDAYRALELLAKHPRIDPERIVVMGFSRGGQAALYAAMKRFQRLHGPEGKGFAGYLVFYPDCRTRYREDEDLADRPIRILHGNADDYNPVDACRDYVQSLRKAGKKVQLIEYAGAAHVFDWVMLKEPRKLTKAQTTRNCRLEERDNGVLFNSRSGQPFTYADPCVEYGPTIAYHADAHQAAQKNVREFLVTALKLSAAGKP
jgi:dienelactone hydrolase